MPRRYSGVPSVLPLSTTMTLTVSGRLLVSRLSIQRFVNSSPFQVRMTMAMCLAAMLVLFDIDDGTAVVAKCGDRIHQLDRAEVLEAGDCRDGLDRLGRSR